MYIFAKRKVMKVKKINEILIKNYEIDYENGVICNYTVKNNRLSDYSFSKENKYFQIIENIDECVCVPWFEYNKVMKIRQIKKVRELKNFNEFDKLFCRESESLLFDINNNVQDSVFFFDDSFFSIFCHIKRKSDADELRLRLEKNDLFYDIQDVEIPYYNGGGDTLTVRCNVSSDIIKKYLEKSNHDDYLDDYSKIQIINELLDDGIDVRIPDVENDSDDSEYCHCECW